MGKLVDLIGSGIGLAIEATSSYQSSQGSKSPQVPDLPIQKTPRSRDDNQAHHELQQYADSLSARIETISGENGRDENYRRYITAGPNTQTQRDIYEKDVSFYAHEAPSQRHEQTGRLSCPVIIPQRRPEDQSRGILRAYAPALESCGIDQETFLEFIDAFNEAHKASPYLDAVNVAAQGVGFAPGIAPMVVSMVVPIAVRAAKGYQTKRQSSTFLDRANKELFAPHGLFAMVLTYRPDQIRDPYGTPNEVQLPKSSPLLYPEDEKRAQQAGFKKMGHFIADYGDRRAQARYAYRNPESALSGPVPTFKSRWGDPNHPANSGGLKSLLTGIPDNREHRKLEREDRKRDRKDRRSSPVGSLSSRRSGLLKATINAVGDGRRGATGRRPSLVGGVKSMAFGPEKQDQGLIKGIKGLGMKTDILYLMITNNTEDQEPALFGGSSARYESQTPYTSPSQQTRPLARYQNFLSDLEEARGRPIPIEVPTYQFQSNDPYRRVNNSSASWALDPHATGTDMDIPPPAYRETLPTGYYDRPRRREEDYCVPTL